MLERERSAWQYIILAIQHVFAMFGATVLVPALIGLDPAVALFTAGAGILLFHICTKRKVPVFLGSSFAFIAAISHVVGSPRASPTLAAALLLQEYYT